MNKIRLANPDDLGALYSISLNTGHLGSDASHLYLDPNMMGHIYSAPYLEYVPDLAFVVERDDKVLGFCVGASDTRDFEAQLEASWLPSLRRTYQKPDEKTRKVWTADERRCQMIHQPETAPKHIKDQFPAHLHMNLLPQIQGSGVGVKLFGRWVRRAMTLGVTAVHIGSNAQNERAIQFWRKQGFKHLEGNKDLSRSRTVWLGRQIP